MLMPLTLWHDNIDYSNNDIEACRILQASIVYLKEL